jgi:hypothetical protein
MSIESMLTTEEKALRLEMQDFVRWVPPQLLLDMDADKVRYPREYLQEAAATCSVCASTRNGAGAACPGPRSWSRWRKPVRSAPRWPASTRWSPSSAKRSTNSALTNRRKNTSSPSCAAR